MKEWLVILILAIPFALAEPTLTFQHEDILPGETVFATIETTGEFTKQILDSDIKFYEGRKEVFFEHGIQFYGETQYIYVYTTREGNFTMKIDNILYKESDQLNSLSIEKNFSVKDTLNSSILSIRPGVVFTSLEPTLKLTNKGEKQINVTIAKETFSIDPVKSYEVVIAPAEVFSLLMVSTYKDFYVPIIFLGLNGSINQSIEKPALKTDNSNVTVSLSAGTKIEKMINLYNLGEGNLTSLKSITAINFMKITKLKDLSSKEILNVTLTFSPENAGYFFDNFTIEYEQNGSQNKLIIPIEVYVSPRGSAIINISDETCEGLNGSVCLSNQTCEGETTFAKNGAYCCLSVCVDLKPDKPGSDFGWMIGLFLLVALGLLGYILYKKQKKVTPPTPEQTITQSADLYSQRINGGVQRT